tara:strand:- start:148 stop:1005 length:858 start_codon:yes stop_codon:yes gene_type:complete
MYIKHSKFKNTGILFEIIVKKITSDTLSGKDSPATQILKKYFINTELGKEYRLYETVSRTKGSSENKANTVLTTVLEMSQKLNRTTLRKEKYNLIKDLKEHYNLDSLFKTKIHDYKTHAAVYTLLEVYNSDKLSNPNQIIDNKVTLLESMVTRGVDAGKVKDDIIEEFKSYDKDVRTLTYYVLLEKFNSKYDDLNGKQKEILKEFINSVDNTSHLKSFYNKEIVEIKSLLSKEIKVVENKALQIKLEGVLNLITELDKRTNIKSDHLVDLLQYHNLLEELKVTHG